MITQIVFGRVASPVYGTQVPAIVARGMVSEVKTANGTTTITAPANGPVVARVSTDTAVYIAFGTTPDATATTETSATTVKVYMPAGTSDFFVVEPSAKCAVATA